MRVLEWEVVVDQRNTLYCDGEFVYKMHEIVDTEDLRFLESSSEGELDQFFSSKLGFEVVVLLFLLRTYEDNLLVGVTEHFRFRVADVVRD